MSTQTVAKLKESIFPSWLSETLQTILEAFFELPPLLTDLEPPSNNPNASKTAEQPYIPPIHRLPYELLLMIFSTEHDKKPPTIEELFSGKRRIHRSLAPEYHLSPIRLGQVCSRWRTVTLGSPLLWSNLRIICTLDPKNIGVLAMWLTRSRDVPLTIQFQETFEDLVSKDPWFKPLKNPITPEMIELLCWQAHRWRHVDFEFCVQFPKFLKEGKFPSYLRLESAKIRSRRETNERFDGYRPLEAVWRKVHDAPRLKKADYEMEAIIALNVFPERMPWRRLTSVNLTTSMDELFNDILPHCCQNLVELVYTDPLARYAPRAVPERGVTPTPDNPHRGWKPHGDLKHITLPALRRFNYNATERPDDAFAHLTVPRLEEFGFVQNQMWLYEDYEAGPVVDMLVRSGCRLRKYSYQVLGCTKPRSIRNAPPPAASDAQAQPAETQIESGEGDDAQAQAQPAETQTQTQTGEGDNANVPLPLQADDTLLCSLLTSPTMSHLTSLTIIAKTTSNLYQTLTLPSPSSPLPHLESLSITHSDMEPGELGRMVEVLKGRCGERFRLFEARYWDRYSEDREIFRAMREREGRMVIID